MQRALEPLIGRKPSYQWCLVQAQKHLEAAKARSHQDQRQTNEHLVELAHADFKAQRARDDAFS